MKLLLLLTLVATTSAWSQTPGASRSTGTTAVTQSAPQATATMTADQIARQVWGLSAEELARAKMLLQGPRAHFSVPNLSPVEALGIHARSDAERRKYAEKFARAQHDDTERVLAWAMAYQQAVQRLYPNEKVIDFTGMAAIPPGAAAEAANLPRPAQPQAAPVRRGGR